VSAWTVAVVEPGGRRAKRVVEASGREGARVAASSDGALVLSVVPSRAAANSLRLSRKALEEFTSMAAILLPAGLTLRDALTVLAESSDSKEARRFSQGILARIDSGVPFVEAVRDSGAEAPAIWTGLARAGERTGSLDAVMPRLAAWLESGREACEKTAGALVYPAIVLSMAVLGMLGLAFWALPRLGAMFAEFGSGGPELSGRLEAAGVSVALVLSFLGALALAWPFVAAARKRNEAFGARFDALLLSVPLLGSLLADRAVFAFAFAMETLVSGGLPLDEALRESAGAVGNLAVARDVLILRDRVRSGASLSKAFRETKRLPRRLGTWFAIGERSGAPEAVFARVRALYERKTARTLERLVALAEPAIILAVGVAMIAMVLLFIVPLFTAYGSLL